ncbi:sulfotransferase [Congregibacter variabilis]|uniref:Sulfotransferase n=1 Tax=Congregibacter variabilis TaxID=3081200 RepID=A0ABZ0I0S1_9GAMM|nr:sulfotransferase [Congregibacter sp. IMCC43200]
MSDTPGSMPGNTPIDPTKPTLQDLLNEGSQLVQARRLQDAETLAKALLSEFGDNAEVRFFASDVESLRGDAPAALEHLDALEESLGSKPRVLLRKAQLCLFDGQWQRALSCAREVDLLEARERELAALSQVFIELGQHKEARNCLLIARDKNPESVQLLYLLAVSEVQLDMLEEAQKHLTQVLELSPADPGALHLRAQLRSWSVEENHVAELRDVLTNSSEPQLTAIASYSLAKELEDLGSYVESYAAYSAGAEAYRGLINYDPATELGAQQDIRDTFTPARVAKLVRGDDLPGPIFIVGMPRSGIRLAERVLASHSAVTGAGELGELRRILGLLARDAAPAEVSDAEATIAVDFAELGRRYMSAARERVGDVARFVDCTSNNFLYCGHILAAMPGARIIHMQRDALDTCYSVFKSLIFGAHSYSYNLEELADYYQSYRAHMQHWREAFPGQILDVSYEGLVQNTDAETRRMLDFCSLEFEQGMLEPGITTPINTIISASKLLPALHSNAIGSAERAGPGFDVLRSRLGDAGVLG